MPTIQLPWGKGSVTFAVDPRRLGEVVRPNAPTAAGDPAHEVRQALQHPVGSDPLEKIVSRRPAGGSHRGTMSPAPTPADRMLPPVLETLARAGVSPSDVIIAVALGSHRPMTEGEIDAKLGAAVRRAYPVFNVDCTDMEQMVYKGTSSQGIAAWVLRPVAEADVRIGIGAIAPHMDAGLQRRRQDRLAGGVRCAHRGGVPRKAGRGVRQPAGMQGGPHAPGSGGLCGGAGGFGFHRKRRFGRRRPSGRVCGGTLCGGPPGRGARGPGSLRRSRGCTLPGGGGQRLSQRHRLLAKQQGNRRWRADDRRRGHPDSDHPLPGGPQGHPIRCLHNTLPGIWKTWCVSWRTIRPKTPLPAPSPCQCCRSKSAFASPWYPRAWIPVLSALWDFPFSTALRRPWRPCPRPGRWGCSPTAASPCPLPPAEAVGGRLPEWICKRRSFPIEPRKNPEPRRRAHHPPGIHPNHNAAEGR